VADSHGRRHCACQSTETSCGGRCCAPKQVCLNPTNTPTNTPTSTPTDTPTNTPTNEHTDRDPDRRAGPRLC
jgi:hypothetical protein